MQKVLDLFQDKLSMFLYYICNCFNSAVCFDSKLANLFISQFVFFPMFLLKLSYI